MWIWTSESLSSMDVYHTEYCGAGLSILMIGNDTISMCLSLINQSLISLTMLVRRCKGWLLGVHLMKQFVGIYWLSWFLFDFALWQIVQYLKVKFKSLSQQLSVFSVVATHSNMKMYSNTETWPSRGSLMKFAWGEILQNMPDIVLKKPASFQALK